MKFITGLVLAFLVVSTADYYTEKHYCKKNYKKKADCKCWTCRFYNECEFTHKFNEKNETLN